MLSQRYEPVISDHFTSVIYKPWQKQRKETFLRASQKPGHRAAPEPYPLPHLHHSTRGSPRSPPLPAATESRTGRPRKGLLTYFSHDWAPKRLQFSQKPERLLIYCILVSYLLAVGVEGAERVVVHASSKRHHAGVRGAQQTLSQGQDRGEVATHDLSRQHYWLAHRADSELRCCLGRKTVARRLTCAKSLKVLWSSASCISPVLTFTFNSLSAPRRLWLALVEWRMNSTSRSMTWQEPGKLMMSSSWTMCITVNSKIFCFFRFKCDSLEFVISDIDFFSSQ